MIPSIEQRRIFLLRGIFSCLRPSCDFVRKWANEIEDCGGAAEKNKEQANPTAGILGLNFEEVAHRVECVIEITVPHPQQKTHAESDADCAGPSAESAPRDWAHEEEWSADAGKASDPGLQLRIPQRITCNRAAMAMRQNELVCKISGCGKKLLSQSFARRQA
jgi:hypothetical protein